MADSIGQKQRALTGERVSRHGAFDLESYDRYLAGKLEDYSLPEKDIKTALEDLPKFQEPVIS